MVLEPLSAFSVACNVLQIIEVGSKVLKNAIDYRKAASGALAEHQDLHNVWQCLKNLSVDLQTSIPKLEEKRASSSVETLLVEANNECLRLSNEFIDFLDSLKVKDRHAMLESLRMSIKSMWYKEKMVALEKSLSRARDNLNVAFLAYINSKQATAKSQDDILKSTSRIEGSILDAVNSSSFSIRNEIKLLTDKLENTTLDASAQQTISDFLMSNRNLLEKMTDQLNHIAEQNSLRLLTNDRIVEDAEQNILSSLQFPQIQERMHRIDEAHEETYRWILQPPLNQPQRWDSLTEWLSSDSDTRRIYWISGKPGSGKSTLMRFLDENLSARDHMLPWAKDCTVLRAHCFFWNPGHELQKSLAGLLRTLLGQLLEQRPSMIPQVVHFRKWRAAEVPSNHGIEWTESELLYSLHEYILNVQNFAKIFLLVDGLDEFEGSDKMRNELIDMFKKLAILKNVKICLSSRPWNIFRDAFSQFPQLQLEYLTQNDIRKYIQSQLESQVRFKHFLRRDRANAEDVIAVTTTKAAGVFLWVRLVVQELITGLQDGDGIHAMQQKLEEIPADLNAYFKRLMNSITPKYRREASIFLQLALHEETEFISLHRLGLFDLFFVHEEVVNFALNGQYDFHEINLTDQRELEFQLDSAIRQLNSRCMGLLECMYEPGHNWSSFDELVEDSENDEPLVYRSAIKLDSAVYTEIFGTHNSICPFKLTIDFLHRSCREFLLTPESQALLHQYSNGPYDARAFLFNSRLAQFMALRSAEKGAKLALGISSYLMSVLSLPSWRNSYPSIVAATIMQPALESLFQNYNLPLSSWYIDSSRALWHEERSSFFTLAIDFNLHTYMKTYLTPEIIRNKQGRPILDYILRPRFIDLPGYIHIGNIAPNLEILQRVLELGADPNEIYNNISVWASFLNFSANYLFFVMHETTTEIQPYFDALALLLDKGAALLLHKSWLLTEQCHDAESFENMYTAPWPRDSLEAIEANARDPSKSWYAVSDLLESFRPYFGQGVDTLQTVIRNRKEGIN